MSDAPSSELKQLAELKTLRSLVRDLQERTRSIESDETWFRDLVETVSDRIWEVDSDWVYVYSSPQVRDILGYAPEEVVGRTPFDFMPPDEAARLKTVVSNCIANRKPISSLESRAIHKSGEILVLETSGVPVIRADGEVRGYRGIDRDITERKRLARGLARSEEKYRRLLEQLPQSVFYKTVESVYVSCNGAFAEALGIDQSEVAGKTDYDFFSQEMAARYRADDARIIESGETECLEEPYQRDGEEFIVHTIKTPVRDDSGETVGILGVFWDITEQKRAEEALKHSEERFRRIAETTSDLVYEWDPESGRMEWFGDFDAALGFERNEIPRTALGWLDLVHPDDRVSLEAAVERRINAGEPFSLEYRILSKDGRWRLWLHRCITISDGLGNSKKHIGSCLDITDKRQAEAEIRNSEHRYRAFIKNSSEGIYRIDLNPPIPLDLPHDEFVQAANTRGVLVEVNDAIAKMYGLEAEEMVGRRPTDFAPTFGLNLSNIQDNDSQCTDIESVDYDNNGNPIWVLVSFQTVVEDGKLVRIWGVQRNITARKRAEESLKRESAFNAAVLKAVDSLVVVLDTEWRVVSFNRACEECSGYTAQEVVGKCVWDLLLAPEERDEVIDILRNPETIDSHERYECHWVTKAGENRLIEWSNSVLRDAEGRVEYILGTGQDVTERREVESALALRAKELTALNAMSRNVIQNLSLDDMVEAALDGVRESVGPDLAFIFVREGEQLRLSGSNLGSSGLTRHAEATHRVGECLCGIAAKTGEPVYAIDVVRDARCTMDECKGAGVKSFAALPLRCGDEIVGVLGVASKTRRRFADRADFLETIASEIGLGLHNTLLFETVTRQREELEQRVADRTRELEAFTYSVSHDLRAPLRHIDGFAKMLSEDCGDVLSKEGHRFLDVIRGGAQKMGNLIDDLLSLSRLGQKETKREVVDVESIVREVWREVISAYPESNIELVVEELPPANADPVLLRQVWLNLLDNAAKYTSTRSEGRVLVQCNCTGDSTWYCIKDNGVGFDQKYAHKLFGVFQRLHLSSEFPGTGVGLAVVQRIIAKHGGRVQAEGRPNAGATFEFTLG